MLERFRTKQTRAPEIRGEFHHLSWLRLVNLIIIGAYLCGFALIIIFVERNVYRILQHQEIAGTLKTSLPLEAIEFNQLDRVSAAWSGKHATTTLTVSRDPFFASTSSEPLAF